MSILKPYETTTGRLTNTKPIVDALLNYITKNSLTDELAYEFYQGDVEIYIITGKNEDEKELPVFNQPVFFRNIRNKESVAIDLRPYVNQNAVKGDFTKLIEVIRDKHSANFLILSMLLLIKTEVSTVDLKPIMGNVISSLVFILSNSVRRISVLNAIDVVNLEIAIAIYGYALFNPDNKLVDDIERITNIISKLKLSFPIDRRTLQEKVSLLAEHEDKLSIVGIPLLKNLIEIYLPEDARAVVNVDAIFSILENGWYGPDGSKSIYIAIESMPVLVALVYSMTASTMFKNSKLASILDKEKNKIGTNDFLKYMQGTYIKKELGGLL